MRSTMKVLVLGTLCLLPPGGPDDVRAAECPSECRREINDVLCREIVTTVDDRETSIVRYYWSDGVR